MRPEFSRQMLRGFLFARSLTIDGFEGKAMVRRMQRDIEKVTGLPASTVEAAFDGRLTDGGARAAIWAVLGHFPSDHGIILTDDGGQA